MGRMNFGWRMVYAAIFIPSVMDFVRKTIQNAPFLYFFAIWSSIGIPMLKSGVWTGLIPLLIATGFIGLVFFGRKSLNLLTGVLMFFWSILILFAYLSDASKLGSTNPEAWSFLFFGGLISVLNFLMSSLIVKKSLTIRPLQGTV